MMLADAIRAETWRLLQNRTALLWSIVFVPVVGLAASIAGNLFIDDKISAVRDRLPSQLRLERGTLDLGQALLEAAGNLANPALLAFLLIGAASVFAGDYRWETWRLITARNSRPNLIMGKAGAVKLIVLAGLLLMLAAAVIGAVAKGLIFGNSFVFHFGAETAQSFGLMFLLAFVRVVQFLLLALLAATVTRSMLAALFVPLVIGVAQAFLAKGAPLLGWQMGDWPTMLLFPGDAYEVLKALIQGGMMAAVLPDGAGWRAVAGLALWSFAPFFMALWWFRRQDLSKE
ncbi:MAG: ABC transporter permease subunit [Brevundimonas sp.]|jgi:ABC-2 type transport system permease protein|uniref:ABC transporter permease subunit n=1 Tax=Brevundimonas sp. TaxID=1871086 RepID=UPI0025C5B288|nr:ABC transporter permease subunit [Brevundimonas sp.]MCH4269286.1 ABC transporter permease subunit [Brevundimonas sp.]